MSQPDPAFEALLEHLKANRGFDFTGYKRTSLTRRVDRRMAQVGVGDYPDYLDHLELHADEFTALFNTILINVTGFFRDPEAWRVLQEQVLPTMLAAKAPGVPLRMWCAGCASTTRRSTAPGTAPTPNARSRASRTSCARGTANRSAGATPSARTCGAR
jgi:two-component system CheB/CheR fusion protein